MLDRFYYDSNGGQTKVYRKSTRSSLKGQNFYSATMGWFTVKKVWTILFKWKDSKISPWHTVSHQVVKVKTTNGEVFVLPKQYLEREGALNPQISLYYGGSYGWA